MSVQIHINGETALEAVQELATLAAALSGQSVASQITATVEAPKQQRTRNVTKPAQVKEPESSPVQQEEAPPAEPDSQEPDPVDPEPETTDGAEDEGPIPTPVDLRAKAQEVGADGGRAEVKALLDKYGSKSISDIPENKRSAFMRDLESLHTKLKEKSE
ncbi:hypothetical protein [Paenibacillus sp. HJGM_3]|uniref:hypothetical protein n=1 Tax=Paenibacillus sp. HJGM_3 TaxID=3379816 RepID=UPI003858E954